MYVRRYVRVSNIYMSLIFICIQHSVAGGVVCLVFAVSDCLVSSATEGSHRRRAPRAPAPRHAVVNKYLLRSSKQVFTTGSLRRRASIVGGQSERDVPREAVGKNPLLLGLYYGRRASSARSCATRRSSKPDAVVKTSRKAVVTGVVKQ